MLTTKTIFLIDKDNSDVFAFFPEEKYNNSSSLFSSYAHIGQHCACHIDYVKECKEANYAQYNGLLKELIKIGYKTEVLNSQQTELHRRPTEAEIKFGYGATHYRTFRVASLLKKNGDLKCRIKAADDGLIYSRR